MGNKLLENDMLTLRTTGCFMETAVTVLFIIISIEKQSC